MGRSFANVSDFLISYARLLAEMSHATAGELRMENHGRIILSRAGKEISLDWLSERGQGQDSGLIGKSVPVVYADAAIGHVCLTWGDDDGAQAAGFVTDCARQLAFLVKRYEVRHWAEQRLGRPLMLVGMSEAVRDLEVFVEKASQSDLPALLHGEFGTETPYLAAAIHCCGQRRDRPFVQINCAQPSGEPDEWFRQAEGGSLFLSDIDALAPNLQNQLPQHMHSRLGQWLDVSSTAKVRVIASATADLRDRVADRTFSRQLLAELDFLSVTMPPLRERTADIEPLVIAALEGNGYRADEKISAELLDLFQTYGWPENAFELERVVARLAVMTGREPIRAEDIRRHFPGMYPQPVSRKAEALPVATSVEAPREDASDDGGEAAAGPEVDRWLHHALNKDVKALATLHPGLRKALLYLVDHYAEPIRLGALARQVHVSQSHLS
ncbi:MAG: sigma 54-interacting transcriptional regulator, partial [Rhodospirillaceae bacterium]|nr:sigma 54-interacting transcriptional regulator [Rhodospirillales bacterium]